MQINSIGFQSQGQGVKAIQLQDPQDGKQKLFLAAEDDLDTKSSYFPVIRLESLSAGKQIISILGRNLLSNEVVGAGFDGNKIKIKEPSNNDELQTLNIVG